MDLVVVLAQEGLPRSTITVAEKFFRDYPPLIAIPVFLVALGLVAFLVERVVVAILRKIASRTPSHVDDALADGLPSVLRPLVFLVGVHVVAHVLLRSETAAGETKLTTTGEFVTKGILFVTTLVVAICVTRLATRMVDAWVSTEESRRPLGPTVKFAIKVAMVPLALLTAFQAIGYDIQTFLTGAAIASLAVGLALQDTLKNMFAGVQILLDRPIRAGDFVEVDKLARGTVLEIGLRSTKLKSPDNNTIIIPNNTISNAIVTNLDYADRSYVQSFAISVAYGSDTRRVQGVLEEVAVQATKDLEGITHDAPSVVLKELGDSAIAFSVSLRFRQWAGRQPLMSEIYHRFYDRLRGEGIEIPFPTRTVILRREAPADPADQAAPPPTLSPAG